MTSNRIKELRSSGWNNRSPNKLSQHMDKTSPAMRRDIYISILLQL